MQATRGDQLKGKLAYMAPEQLVRGPLDRGADIYATSIVLWELLTRERLFQGDDEVSTFRLALDAVIRAPSEVLPELPKLLDPIVLKGLARNRADRFATAREMARALEATGLLASDREVGDWVERIAKEPLAARAERLLEVERGSSPELHASDLDPQQAREDASLMRKIDRRPGAEAATEIVDAPEDETASSGALAAPASRPPPARRGALFAAILACLALGSALVLVRASRRDPSPLPRQSSAQASAATPGALSAPPSSLTSPIPVEPAAPELTATGAPTVVDSAPPASQRTRSVLHSSQTARPLPKPKTDCSVPFTIDDHGVRIPKRQCL
jgi:serine/threonine-protein kinase